MKKLHCITCKKLLCGKQTKFCCHKCSIGLYAGKIEKNCFYCKRLFYVFPSRKNIAKFCSSKCAALCNAVENARKAVITKKGHFYPHPGRRIFVPQKFCAACSKELTRPQARRGQRFCSNPCASSMISWKPSRLRKISKAVKGRVVSLATRQKISISNKGKKRSLEVRLRHRERFMRDAARTGFLRRSKAEIAFGKKIKEVYGIRLVSSKKLEGRFFDYCFGKYLFELDGSFWHRTKEQLATDQLKNEIAKRNGYILYRFQLDAAKYVEVLVDRYHELFQEIFKKEKPHVSESVQSGSDSVAVIENSNNARA